MESQGVALIAIGERDEVGDAAVAGGGAELPLCPVPQTLRRRWRSGEDFVVGRAALAAATTVRAIKSVERNFVRSVLRSWL